MKKTKVLVVDDYPENIKALCGLIQNEDIDIYTAETPDRALELLYDYDFGLALLDVQMPEMSGFELARLIRGVKRHQHLPIIFVTAQQKDQSFEFEGYDSGAVDILFKPLDPHIVRTKVRIFVELSQQKIMLEKQVGELNFLRNAAEAANLAKTQFLANMSHEIRTPLAAVMGFAELLASQPYSNKERLEYIDIIHRNGDLLMRLIDDILDLSKIESDHIELEEVDFDFGDLISDLKSTMMLQAKKKNLKFEMEDYPVGQSYCHGDVLRIKQILINVIGNAIKFTSTGKVAVHFDIKSSAKKQGYYSTCFKISDTGIGMTQEHIKSIFNPFSQGDSSMRRNYGGSGLGLAISRRLARIYNGDITILDCKPQKGSVFEVSFELISSKIAVHNPQVLETNKDVEESTESTLKGLRLLAVDDSKENLTLLRLYLKETGIEVVEVTNGKEAIEKVKKQHFDIVMMDVQMPEMDGREATKILRQNGYKKPIIALTAHAALSEQSKCLEAGFDFVLTKPIRKKHLVEKLSNSFSDNLNFSRSKRSTVNDQYPKV